MKVSIITVCLNSAKTIEKTIQSVIKQSYYDIEYSIIDGGSIDGTIDIIKKYEKYINKWVSEPDRGLYDAMNKGIREAAGDVIGIINSDDWYACDAVEKIVHYFKMGSCDITYGDLTFVYPDGREEMASAKDINLNDMKYKNVLWHPTVFVKKNVYELYGCYDLKYKIYADYDFLLRTYYKGCRICYVPHNLAFFRVDGLHNRMPRRTFLEERKIAIENLTFLEDFERDLVKKLVESHYEIERKNQIKSYLLKRMKRNGKLTLYVHLSMCEFFGDIPCFSIFGAGKEGGKCYRILRNSHIQVEKFIDNDSFKWNKMYEGISVVKPNVLEPSELSNRILISSKKYGNEIQKQLEKGGFKYKKDFIHFSDVEDRIISLYIKSYG